MDSLKGVLAGILFVIVYFGSNYLEEKNINNPNRRKSIKGVVTEVFDIRQRNIRYKYYLPYKIYENTEYFPFKGIIRYADVEEGDSIWLKYDENEPDDAIIDRDSLMVFNKRKKGKAK